jgi:YD repeat-containing protein
MTRPTGTQTRTFTYNGPYLQSATNPENGTVSYTYNSYNKVATKTDAKGQQFSYTYDSYARLTEIQVYPQGPSNAADPCQQVNYYYDTNPFDSTYSGSYSSGRLTAIQYYGGSAAFAHNSVGPNCDTTFQEMYDYSQPGGKIGKRLRVTRTLETGDPDYSPSTWGWTTVYFDLDSTYTYDNEGRMTAVQYPSYWNTSTQSTETGPNLGWAFDTMGRLNTMTDLGAGTSIISAATYNPSNQLLTMSGLVSESRTYNSMLQLTQLTVSTSAGTQVNTTYTYSGTQNNGKIISQYDAISGETVQYTPTTR